MRVNDASKLEPPSLGPFPLDPLSSAPILEPPSRCFGAELCNLAGAIDRNNAQYVAVATQVCQALLQNLSQLSSDHVKKLNDRSSLLQSSQVWSTVLNLCSFIGSAMSLFAGISSQNPTASVVAIGLGLLPFIYNALSTGVEQKDLEKGAAQFGCLLATALFFSYFKAHIPTFEFSNLSLAAKELFNITHAVSGMTKGVYSARLTWKKGELETLEFLMKAIERQVQEMSGSMTDNIKSVATNFSFLQNVVNSYVKANENFIFGG